MVVEKTAYVGVRIRWSLVKVGLRGNDARRVVVVKLLQLFPQERVDHESLFGFFHQLGKSVQTD